MLQIKNTTLEFLPLAGILTLIFRTSLYFLAQKTVFSALSAYRLNETDKQTKTPKIWLLNGGACEFQN